MGRFFFFMLCVRQQVIGVNTNRKKESGVPKCITGIKDGTLSVQNAAFFFGVIVEYNGLKMVWLKGGAIFVLFSAILGVVGHTKKVKKNTKNNTGKNTCAVSVSSTGST